MNLSRLIRLAIALGEHGNFARAAQAMKLSQPSLTRGIAELERALSVRLFDRTSRGAFPTVYGRVLIERGELMLRSEASLRREIQMLAGFESGSIGISAGPLAAGTSVAPAIARVLSAHPRLKILCRTGEPEQVVRDVLDERVDVGVARVRNEDLGQRLTVETLPPLRVYLACRPDHSLTKLARPTLADAFDYPLAMDALTGVQAAAILNRDESLRLSDLDASKFVSQVVVDSPAVARAIARHSDALTAGTEAMLAPSLAAGFLVALEIDSPALRTVYSVFYLRDRTLAPAARLLIDAMHSIEAEAAAAEAVEGAGSRATKHKARGHRIKG